MDVWHLYLTKLCPNIVGISTLFNSYSNYTIFNLFVFYYFLNLGIRKLFSFKLLHLMLNIDVLFHFFYIFNSPYFFWFLGLIIYFLFFFTSFYHYITWVLRFIELSLPFCFFFYIPGLLRDFLYFFFDLIFIKSIWRKS
jgi:hypothetical protein